AVDTEHLRVRGDLCAALGADGAGMDLQGVERRLLDRAEVRVRRVIGIAVETVVEALAAVEIGVAPLDGEAVEARHRRLEPVRIDPDRAGERRERRRLREPLGGLLSG